MSRSYSAALEEALARIAAEGVEVRRDQLLLWLVRHVFDVGDADSYENVFSAPVEISPNVYIDGAVVIQRRETATVVYLVESSDNKVLGERTRALSEELIGHADPERTFARRSPRLRSVFEPAFMPDSPSVVRTVAAVSPDILTKAQLTRITKCSVSEEIRVDALDPSFFDALAVAERDRVTSVISVEIPASKESVLDLGIPGTPAVVLPVYASEVAGWPGVEDRTLFDLNVRHALGVNKVRKSLDQALKDDRTATQFIAYHNGITAICEKYDLKNGLLKVSGLSVVNGAQTVVAINANREHIAPDVRLLLKLVVADSGSDLARSIAVKSNTQNPVTSRNLRALDAVQERLSGDLEKFGYVYLTRPDQSAPTGARVISNDDVAQLLCSIYSRKPALAVKRQVLFENPQYQEIFPEDLDSNRIIFAHLVRQAVNSNSHLVPPFYRGAWALTALTVVYMTAEAIRADHDFSKTLDRPMDRDVNPPQALMTRLQPFIEAACTALENRRRSFDGMDDQTSDDFKVDFKHTRVLGELGASAAKVWRAKSRSSRP